MAQVEEISNDIRRFVFHPRKTHRYQRINPVVRFLIPLVLMTGVLASGDPLTFYIFTGLNIAAAAALQVLILFWSRFWKIALTVSIFTLGVRAFFEYGDHVVFNVGPLAVTQEGLASANWYVAMLLAVCAPLVLLTSILSLQDLSHALELLGARRQVCYVVINSARLIPELATRGKAVRDAQRSRGIQVEGSRLVKLKAVLPTIAPLVLSALSSVEERAVAMEVRGASITEIKGTRLIPQDKISGFGYLCIFVAALLSVFIGIGGRLLW